MALGTKAGGIYLDLNINKKGFQSQLGGIEKMAAKAGAAIAGAFTVSKLVQFGKECIDLGSDLAEVQNIVDVAFPRMSSVIDEFAQNAAAKFGLSETMAKRFSGTFGSMAEAFGFSESAAADMATTLTGLAGDVASFYNISQDEAYTKLKSVFTGETESLKDLGVVMTQTALDQYALANGFGKTTSAMSEAEKVSLRYAFVQNQLTNAASDFARTSDSWANQVRLLSLQFDSLRAAIGEGLINILKPVVQWLNLIIKRLIQAAQAFAKFTSIFSKGKASSGASAVASSVADAASAGVSLGDSAGSASSGLSKAAAAAKKLKRELAGFDQITKLGEQDSDSGSGSGGAGGGAGGVDGITDSLADMAQQSAKEVDKAFYPVIEKIKKGFQNAFKADPKQLLRNFSRIEAANRAVWQSPEVQGAITNFKLKAAEALGSVAGSAASVAVSFSTGISGGIAAAKEDLIEFNKTKISSIFDNLSSLCDTVTDLSGGISTIAKAFEGKGFQKIVEVVEKVLNVTVLNALDFITGILSDLAGGFRSIWDNADGFRIVLEDVFDIISILLEPIEAVFDKISENAKAYKDSAFHKFFEQLQKIHSAGLGTALELIHQALTIIKGVLEKKISLNDVWKMIFGDSGKIGGNISDGVLNGMAEVFKNPIKWIKKNVLDPIVKGFKNVFDIHSPSRNPKILGIGENIFLGVLNGVIKGVDGIGTWVKKYVFNPFLNAFRNAGSFFKQAGSTIWNGIVNAFGSVRKTLTATVTAIRDKAFDTAKKLWDAVKSKTEKLTADGGRTSWFNDVKTKWDSIKSKSETITANGNPVRAFSDLVSRWNSTNSKTVTATANGNPTSSFHNVINMMNGLRDKTITVTLAAKAKNMGIGQLIKLAGLKTGGILKSGRWQPIQGYANGGSPQSARLFYANENGMPELVGRIGSNTAVMNNGQIVASVAAGVYQAVAAAFGQLQRYFAAMTANLGNIPRALGTVIPDRDAITPRLAMTSDKKQRMAAENQVLEMARQAADLSGGGHDAEIVNLLKQILAALGNLKLVADVDVYNLKKLIVQLINDHTRATGMCEIEI